jgi:hypothetical protein
MEVENMNLEQIIEEVNRDLDESLESSEILGWINRCIGDLSSIAKKETKSVFEISTLNGYELPEELLEMVLVLVNGMKFDTVPLTDSWSTGYKKWGMVLSLQNAPTEGQMEVYYYKRLSYLEKLDDVPEIEEAFHDLFVLYTIAYNQFMEEESDRQMDAISRYNIRKAEFQRFVMDNSFVHQAQRQIIDVWS